MKSIYKNITVPYKYYNVRKDYYSYIYNDQEYFNLNELFTKFVGNYLTYHFDIDNKTKTVHSLEEVVINLLNHSDTFKISTKEEYSKDELEYLKGLQNLINKKDITKPKDGILVPRPHKRRNIKIYKDIKYFKDNYSDIIIPKKVYSKIFKRYYYTSCGEKFYNIFSALEMIYPNSFYYPYGGNKKVNNRTHLHCHSFTDLISAIFKNYEKFKINDFQKESYSNQELELITKILNKLKSMNYHNVKDIYSNEDYEEYSYLKENNHKIKLFLFETKWYIKEKKHKRDIIKSHKI